MRGKLGIILLIAFVASPLAAKESIDALRKKKIDAFSSDQIVLIGLALKEHDPMNFVIKSDVFSFEPFALFGLFRQSLNISQLDIKLG
jgi:ABC-type amino acid transport substrate-binding protein